MCFTGEGPNCTTQTEAYLTLEGAIQSSNNHSLAHVSHLLTKLNNNNCEKIQGRGGEEGRVERDGRKQKERKGRKKG